MIVLYRTFSTSFGHFLLENFRYRRKRLLFQFKQFVFFSKFLFSTLHFLTLFLMIFSRSIFKLWLLYSNQYRFICIMVPQHKHTLAHFCIRDTYVHVCVTVSWPWPWHIVKPLNSWTIVHAITILTSLHFLCVKSMYTESPVDFIHHFLLLAEEMLFVLHCAYMEHSCQQRHGYGILWVVFVLTSLIMMLMT